MNLHWSRACAVYDLHASTHRFLGLGALCSNSHRWAGEKAAVTPRVLLHTTTHLHTQHTHQWHHDGLHAQAHCTPSVLLPATPPTGAPSLSRAHHHKYAHAKSTTASMSLLPIHTSTSCVQSHMFLQCMPKLIVCVQARERVACPQKQFPHNITQNVSTAPAQKSAQTTVPS